MRSLQDGEGRAGSGDHPKLREGGGPVAQEEREEASYATASFVKQAFLEAGWSESELNDLERWFRGEWLALQHPDTEEL